MLFTNIYWVTFMTLYKRTPLYLALLLGTSLYAAEPADLCEDPSGGGFGSANSSTHASDLTAVFPTIPAETVVASNAASAAVAASSVSATDQIPLTASHVKQAFKSFFDDLGTSSFSFTDKVVVSNRDTKRDLITIGVTFNPNNRTPPQLALFSKKVKELRDEWINKRDQFCLQALSKIATNYGCAEEADILKAIFHKVPRLSDSQTPNDMLLPKSQNGIYIFIF